MTGNDTDDHRTVEQQREPKQADRRVADGGTADPAATGGGNQAQTGETSASEASAGEAPSGDVSSSEASADDSRTSGERLAWVVQIGALVVLCLLALLATFRFYFAASQAIEVWISDDFVSVFQAAFNLLVLIASVYGVSMLVRRLG